MFVCGYVMCVCALERIIHTGVPVWRSQDNLQESVLSFYYIGLWDQARSSGLVASIFYPLSHLARVRLSFFIILKKNISVISSKNY